VQSEKFIEAHQDHYKKNNGKKLSIDPRPHLNLRAGEQPDNMASGKDEPCYPRD